MAIQEEGITMNMIKGFRLSLALSAGLLVLSGNTVYQWTDEDGVVHFSQTAPTDKNQAAVETSLRSAARTGGTFAPPAVEPTTDEQSGSGTESAEPDMSYKKIPENCARAREMMASLESGRQIRFRDAETGEITYATDESRALQRERAEAAIARDC